jgi:hypothetical protein
MIKKDPIVIFTTLAMNQTEYFLAIAAELQKQKNQIVFISFHDRSDVLIKKHGYLVYNVHDYSSAIEHPRNISSHFHEKYEVNLNNFISHEKYFFNECDSKRLVDKTTRYFSAVENIFEIIESGNSGNISIIQELGGFIALRATYHVSMRKKYTHYFMEPSFISGRMFMQMNTLSSFNKVPDQGLKASAEIREMLSDVIKHDKIVVPQKDKWKHQSVIKILTSPARIIRLAQKVSDKYIFNKKEELDYISVYVFQHVRMLINKYRLQRHYQIPGEKYIYFPLHVPADMVLTVRSPEYLDQYALLDYVARIIPYGYGLVIKEHPVLVGGIDYSRVSALLNRHDNICLCDPNTNNFKLVESASLVLTINSKAGMEAWIKHKPVIVLGDAFYSTAPGISNIDRLTDLGDAIIESLQTKYSVDQEDIEGYLQLIWNNTIEGEIWEMNQNKIKSTAKELNSLINTINT